MAIRYLALALAATVGAATLATAQQPGGFEWPEASATAIPDARLGSVIEDAKEAARQATDRALEGRRASAHARRRNAVRGAIGLGEKPMTIDAGTVMTAVPFDGENGPMIGKVSYPSGASMTGAFGPDIGVYLPSFTSSIAEFAGWCYGAHTRNPQPTDGEFRFKSGDWFVGSRSGTEFHGIYYAAGNDRRFTGTIVLDGAAPRPMQGVMQDRSGRVLATVLRPS